MSSLSESQPAVTKDEGGLDAPGAAEQGSPPEIVADLPQIAEAFRTDYLSAQPWPHVVLTDIVDPTLIATAEREELQPALGLELERSYRKVKAESPDPYGPAARQILDSLLAPTFVAFLEDLTGVSGLIPDPTHYWSGLHVNPPGAFQALHRDFRLHPITGLFHRINVLLYLNSDWSPEYGGELELWERDKSACGKQVLPTAGTMAIFEAGPTAFHGIPEPIRCPPGRARLSLATIYYTKEPPPDDHRETRFIRPKRPQDPWHMGFGSFSDAVNLVKRTIERRAATHDGPRK